MMLPGHLYVTQSKLQKAGSMSLRFGYSYQRQFTRRLML